MHLTASTAAQSLWSPLLKFLHLFALIFTHSVFALQQNTPVAFKFCILYLCLSYGRITWQLENNTVLHADTRPKSESFQSSCCNKLPINEAALFFPAHARCWVCDPICLLHISAHLFPHPQLHITFCPRLWQTSAGLTLQLGSRPWGREWLVCIGSWDHSGLLSQPPHTSALQYVVVDEVFGSFT